MYCNSILWSIFCLNIRYWWWCLLQIPYINQMRTACSTSSNICEAEYFHYSYFWQPSQKIRHFVLYRKKFIHPLSKQTLYKRYWKTAALNITGNRCTAKRIENRYPNTREMKSISTSKLLQSVQTAVLLFLFPSSSAFFTEKVFHWKYFLSDSIIRTAEMKFIRMNCPIVIKQQIY